MSHLLALACSYYSEVIKHFKKMLYGKKHIVKVRLE